MSDDLESDGLDEAVAEIEEAALSQEDRIDRMPWHYMGWAIFCDASENGNGKPIAFRPDEIIAVRPGARGRCGLTIRNREKTVIVYGEFLDCLDASEGLQPPETIEYSWHPPAPAVPGQRGRIDER